MNDATVQEPFLKVAKIARPRIPFNGCPLCESKQAEPLLTVDCTRHPLHHPSLPDRMNWLRCRDCSHVFTDGYFSPEALAVVFRHSHESQTPGHDFERQRQVSAKIVEKVARHAGAGRWLDVGFGNGSLLLTAEEWGFKPVGLDLRPSSVNLMRELGVEAYCEELENFRPETKFSVISMADVLEHAPDPRSFLVSAKTLLAHGGVLFLSMPSYDSPAWRLLDRAKANPYWAEIEHYHNFSRRRLYELLEETGFRPVNYAVSERYRVGMEIIAELKDQEAQPKPSGSKVNDEILRRLKEALALYNDGREVEAKALFEDLLLHEPDQFDALQCLAQIESREGNVGKAEVLFRRAIALDSSFADVYLNYANLLRGLGRLDEAIINYDKAISIRPDAVMTLARRANVFLEMNRYDEAIQSYDQAISINPEIAAFHSNRGLALFGSKKYEAAIAAYDKAISLQPGYATAHANRGTAFRELKRLDEAIASYERALALDPSYDGLLSIISHLKMGVADWTDHEELSRSLEREIEERKNLVYPFAVLGLFDDPQLQAIAARTYVKTAFPAQAPLPSLAGRTNGGKIRLGYFSADFYNHATVHLMAQMFELHDRDRFELIAFSFGRNVKDELRGRVERSFDRFIDVRLKSDREIAELARSLGIDIAVDLKGYTKDSRTGIFALRCADIQVNYLGYPGTMGAPYIDYVVVDPTLIPVESQSFYDEKVVYLPHSYQVNDSGRRISDKPFTRTELGLPPDGFVFCCFNANYKITPAMFDSWMRILRAVEGSVLWLLEDNRWSVENLRKEAVARGVSSDRLVFAPRMQPPEHLARHRLAGLFLDTLPCNAHTTASDALWAGLPVLTQIGASFAGRVAASLLNAVGLPELIVTSVEDYEAMAIRLARDPHELESLTDKLAARRLSSKLFDTPLFVRHIEAAFVAMHERHQAGLPPDHIHIEDQSAPRSGP